MMEQQWKPHDIEQAFFEVESRPLFMQGLVDYEKLPRHRAIVDVDRNRPFSVVTDEYELVTNQQAFAWAEDIMREVFLVTKLEDLVCLNVTMPSTRSFCHIDLVHKSADFSPWEDDKWTAFLRITNSYNRTRLLRFELGFCRWICLNGIIFGQKSIEFSFAHTRRGIDNIHRFADNIGDIRRLEKKLTENFHQLKRYYVPESDMIAILCRAFGIKLNPGPIENEKRKDNLRAFRDQVNKLISHYFPQMGSHGYAALNVLTDYASRPKDGISPAARMHSLQQKCGSWVDDFVSAIQQPNFSFDDYLKDYRQTAEILEAL